MVRWTLAAARQALRRLFFSAPPTAAQDDGKGGSDEEEGGDRGGDSLPRGNTQARQIEHHHNHGHIHEKAAADDMAHLVANKENLAPADADVAGVSAALGQLKLGSAVKQPLVAVVDEDPRVVREREQNLRFIGEALDMVRCRRLSAHGSANGLAKEQPQARLALRTNETPVGCVLVHKGQMIAKGMNATNVTRNGTRHAELMAISALLSVTSDTGPRTTSLRPKQQQRPPAPPRDASSSLDSSSLDDSQCGDAAPPDQGNEDGSKGHLYPYGQKLHASGRVDRRILHDSVLYVTVEPCVMCASLLRQFGIKKVYFGAVNDKFGGTGGVFSIHANSLPVGADGSPSASAHPLPPPQRRQSQLPDSSGTLGTSYPPGGGDGGNVEPGYEIEGGWGRDEAVGLLRRFYVQENGRGMALSHSPRHRLTRTPSAAPVPRKKEGRAARLAAMIEKDSNGVDVAATNGVEGPDEETAADQESYPVSAEGGKENTAPAVSEGKTQSTSDDDDVDHEFYLGLAERTRHRSNFAL